MNAKSSLLAALVTVCCGILLVSGTRASHKSDPEKPQSRYEELARFKYGPALVGGVGFARCPTGFTIVSLDSPADATRFAISAAFERRAPETVDLRVRATDKDGRVVEPTLSSQASGSGSDLGVVTLVCEFGVEESHVEQLIVERRSSR